MASVEAEAHPPALPMLAKISRGPKSSSLTVTYRLPQPVTFSRVSPRSTGERLGRTGMTAVPCGPSSICAPRRCRSAPLRLTSPMLSTWSCREPSR